VEPRVLDGLDDTLAYEHPPHAGISDRLVLRGALDVLGAEELECATLGEKVLVPLLDRRKVLKVLHHVEAARDVVGALQEVEKVLGLEDHVRVDPHHGVVLNLALERLLIRALQDVPTEALGACEMNDGRVLLTDHDLVALGGGLHQKVRPGQEKLA